MVPILSTHPKMQSFVFEQLVVASFAFWGVRLIAHKTQRPAGADSAEQEEDPMAVKKSA